MPRRNLIAIVLVGTVSLLCWQRSQGARTKDETMELYGLFVDAVEQVEANYVRKVPRRELMESALHGMLEDLDPHSTYFNEREYKLFKKQIDGSFTGIGVSVEADPNSERLRILAPLVGSPAFAAGIYAGDEIVEIDGQSTEGWTLDRASEAMTGQPGTEVKLKVRHVGNDKPEVLTIARAIVDTPSVLGDRRKPDDTWDYMLDKEKKIGYVRLTMFDVDTTKDLKKALAELKDQGMKALVLDLRTNPGGLLSSAVEVSDLFIESGKIVTTKGRNTQEKVYEADLEGTYSGFPMVVLINGLSASASEIVAACLQDHGRAQIVGSRSFGKGSVQSMFPLEGGESVLKLTVAAYLRPSGKNIHKFKDAKEADEWGVKPDKGLESKLTSKEFETWVLARHNRDLLSSHNKRKEAGTLADKQLDKAIEALKAKLGS